MRVKTGETATARLIVDVQYQCSACGKGNLTTQTIKGCAHTATIMGINLDGNLYQNAENELRKNLDAVLDQSNSKRFRQVGFNCHCKNCGHVEPWAQMNYDHLEKTNTICMSILIVSVIMSLVGLNTRPFNVIHFIFFILLVLSATACIGVVVYKSKNNEKMERLITALPPESLPTILPHSKERHNMFKKSTEVGAAEPTSYDTWVCTECNMRNSVQYSQCKKCGKFKNL